MSFKFSSVAHFFATAVRDAKNVAGWLASHQGEVKIAGETAVAVVSAVDPAVAPMATLIERAGEELLGKALEAITAAGAAADQKGVSVALDVTLVNDIKDLAASIEKLKPGALNVPAGLPHSTAAA